MRQAKPVHGWQRFPTQVSPTPQSPQSTVPPQPFEAIPQFCEPQMLGVQQLPKLQVCPIKQLLEQSRVPPQPSDTLASHTPKGQAVVGVQQIPALQAFPIGQLPQFTAPPQPSSWTPHDTPEHV